MTAAVVTGAAGGMGLALVRRLIAAQWTVHAWDAVPHDLEGAHWRQVDVADAAAVAAAAAEVETCDLLFNGAGVAEMAPAAEMEPATWARVIGINLTGTFLCCRALHPALKGAGGVIVNVASTRSYEPAWGRSAYATAKAGVVMLTRSLGLEWAADGIRVVAIAPGYVRTPMVQQQLEIGGLRSEVIMAHTPARRMAEPEEVAELVLALAGQTFDFMTATTLVFDGGWLANGTL